MFGSLGVSELLLIFAVILIVFGPRRLPEIGKTLGKALGEFRKATDDLKNTIEREVRLEELKTIAPDIRSSVDSIARDPISMLAPVSSPEPPLPEPPLPETAEADAGDAAAGDAPGSALRPEPDYLADPDNKRPESA
jgi:TatA/E family protein of Tat protein translocase